MELCEFSGNLLGNNSHTSARFTANFTDFQARFVSFPPWIAVMWELFTLRAISRDCVRIADSESGFQNALSVTTRSPQCIVAFFKWRAHNFGLNRALFTIIVWAFFVYRLKIGSLNFFFASIKMRCAEKLSPVSLPELASPSFHTEWFLSQF